MTSGSGEQPAAREQQRRIRDPPPGAHRWIEDAERVDLAICAAMARTPTPALDRTMRRL